MVSLHRLAFWKITSAKIIIKIETMNTCTGKNVLNYCERMQKINNKK